MYYTTYVERIICMHMAVCAMQCNSVWWRVVEKCGGMVGAHSTSITIVSAHRVYIQYILYYVAHTVIPYHNAIGDDVGLRSFALWFSLGNSTVYAGGH